MYQIAFEVVLGVFLTRNNIIETLKLEGKELFPDMKQLALNYFPTSNKRFGAFNSLFFFEKIL